jgi:hypothetical protein
MFIVEQGNVVTIIKSGVTLTMPFLDEAGTISVADHGGGKITERISL